MPEATAFQQSVGENLWRGPVTPREGYLLVKTGMMPSKLS